MEAIKVQIVKVISEHKRFARGKRPAPGFKRVMAAVRFPNSKHIFTSHCDTQDGKTGFAKPS